MDQNGQLSVPIAAAALVLGGLGLLVLLAVLFKGNVHF